MIGTPIYQHNLIPQVAAGRFLMVGDGANRKPMAYVDKRVRVHLSPASGLTVAPHL